MKSIIYSLLLFLSFLFLNGCTQEKDGQKADFTKPNILFISIDDLNDWSEPLAGNSQALTPNLSKFGEEAVNFTRNYCVSPGCNPSRTSTMTGLYPYNSGMYSNYQDWRKVKQSTEAIHLAEYFKQNGYYTAGAGKIYHYSQVHPKSWDDYFPSQTQNMPADVMPENRPANMTPFKYMYSMFDWSAMEEDDSLMGDYKTVDYISNQLAADHNKPFFLAAGIYRPHLPWYVPAKYFDLFPLDSIKLPATIPDDTTDLGMRAKELISRGGNYHKHVVEAHKWKEAVQGYLASIAAADAMVGLLLENLANSQYADNTIVIIWSDHGWQLGEKMHWRKFALWENTIRTLLMIKVPEQISNVNFSTSSGGQTINMTSLVDLYPTLVELAGLPENKNLDGNSLVPILENPDTVISRSILTSYDFADYSVRKENWHYIQYVDDSEELYNLETDPEEWQNLAGIDGYNAIIDELRKEIPVTPTILADSTLIELSEHHVPPVTSKEYYFSRERQEWLKRFEDLN